MYIEASDPRVEGDGAGLRTRGERRPRVESHVSPRDLLQ